MIRIDRIDLCQGGEKICQVGPWSIQRGDRWWVRGPNGCGKSTLLRVLAGELWPAPGQHEQRRYQFDAEESTWSPLAAKGRVTLLTPKRQNRYLHQDWDLTAAEVVATGFLDTDILHERPRAEEFARLGELMDQLGIRELWDRPFLELSQGERRRVLIARALANDPDVLLLDEFAEGLDQEARESLWAMLASPRMAGKAIILTTHRDAPLLEGWQALDVEPMASGAAKVEPARVGVVDSDEVLVHVQGDLYLESQLLVQDLDWMLFRGQHTVVLGVNGSGKTSILRLLWGELHLKVGGQVTHFGNPELTVRELRKQVSYFQPDMHAWFRPEQDVQEVILSGIFSTIDLYDPVNEQQRETMRATAKRFGVTALLERPFDTLSYGQARRVLLARVLVANPRLVLLDEPFDGLDADVREEIFAYLDAMASSGECTFVMTSHHAEDQPKWIRRVIEIDPETRRLEEVEVEQ